MSWLGIQRVVKMAIGKTDIALQVRDLNNRVVDIRREQQYQKVTCLIPPPLFCPRAN